MRNSSIEPLESIALDSELAETDWQSCFDHIASQIGVWSDHHKLSGASAKVLFWRSQTRSKIISLPAGTSTRQAHSAMALSLIESENNTLDNLPHAIFTLPSSSKSSEKKKQTGKVHILGCVEDEQSMQLVANAIQNAGMTLSAILPACSVATVQTIQRTLELAHGHQPVLLLRTDDHESTLVGACNNQILFIRQIRTGMAQFISAWLRPISRKGPDESELRLTEQQASELFMTQGIPSPDLEIPQYQITGRDLLPSMQPIIQKLSVEIKQTARFGFETHQRDAVKLYLAGPGGNIPRMGEVLSAHLDIPCGQNDSQASNDSLLASALKVNAKPIDLSPQTVCSLRTLQGSQKALWIGVAAAFALIMADGLVARHNIQQSKDQLQQLDTSFKSTQVSQSQLDLCNILSTTLAMADQNLADAFKADAPWPFVLDFIAKTTPANIRLTNITLEQDKKLPIAKLHGMVLADKPEIGAQAIKAYLDQLNASPILNNGKLGTTQRLQYNGKEAQQFSLAFSVMPMSSIKLFANQQVAAVEDGK